MHFFNFFSKLHNSLKKWMVPLTFKSLILYIILSLSQCVFTDLLVCNAQASTTVWDVLRNEFKLDHHTNQAAVHHQLRWLINHPSYLHKLAQSEPYIYHIIKEIKHKKLPGEIALIPMIESAYDPFAYSGAGAAGLWQLMPGTGSDLGLKHDWWFDARRSIGASTEAALNYFVYLKKFFHNNWLLAIAAYDSGEGTISRLIKAHQSHWRQPDFWQLPVPNETKAYVPRLLALAEIIQNPQRYGIKLPEIPYIPYFEEVNIGSQIDLNHAAQLAEMPYKDLLKLNPGFNRWATSPFQPYKLLLPTDKAELFSKKLALIPPEKRVSLSQHQMGPHDNLNNIAKQYHTSVTLLKNINQLTSNKVTPGQTVLIPSQTNHTNQTSSNISKPTDNFNSNSNSKKQLLLEKPNTYKIIHIVQKNETIQSIENRYQISLPHGSKIHTGQALVLWINKSHSTIKNKPQHIAQNKLYKIKKGDTLSHIAKLYHTKIALINKLNPKLHKNRLKIGQKIYIS